jgi:pimeloyl-ACP methyl ester carboxylesterase
VLAVASAASGVVEVGRLGAAYDRVMVHERSVDVRGRAVRFLESGAGRPVVLLHAFPLGADMWRPQLEHPAESCRYLAPDLKGLGPADGPPATSIDDMAGDVCGWLDALALDVVTVGGLSMGGYVVFSLLRQAGERVSAVILANTKAAADTHEGRANRDRMLALVRAEGPGAVADQMLPKLLGRTSQERSPALGPRIRRMIEANTTDGLGGAIQAMKGRPDATGQLGQIRCPVLVVAGDEDELIPAADVEAMHRALPRSQMMVLKSSGHLSNLETPTGFSTALADFLRAS